MNVEMIKWCTALLLIVIIARLSHKVASHHLPAQTAPIFVGVWLLIGFVGTAGFFQNEWVLAYRHIVEKPWIALPVLAKGALITFFLNESMNLYKKSLSAQNFVIPSMLSVGPLVLMLFGEQLSLMQLVLSVLMGCVGLAFFLFGHLSELGKQGKKSFFYLALSALGMMVADYLIIDNGNWVLLLFGSTAFQIVIVLLKRYKLSIWRQALFSWRGTLAGVAFAIHEFISFYQMGTITPVTITVAVKAGAIPFIQLAAAIIWKERTWGEQLIWGTLTMMILIGLAFA